MKPIGLALLFVLLSSFSFAWWDPSFQYRTPININSSVPLTDYQVQANPQIYNNTGLVGSWHFSEGSGTKAADSSGNGNDGTLTNGPLWVSGKSSYGMQFDGTNDYLSVPDSNAWTFGPNSFSIDFWVKLNEAAPASRKPIISGGTSITNDHDTFSFYQSTGGKWELSLYTTNKVWAHSSASDTANWHNIAIVRQSGINDFYVYVDGVQLSGTVVSGGWLVSNSNFNFPSILLGHSWDIGYFNGAIDEVRIYNRSLSPQEISELYNASKARLDYADLRFTQPYTIYETPISLSGTGSALTDYQVMINITNQTILSHMRPDGADLRFFSSASSTPYSSSGLSYWIESINITSAKVWVKANISAGGSTIYMYYGNASASSQSNGSNAFEFFDDFDRADGTVGNGWAAYDGTWVIASKQLKSTSTGGGYSDLYKPYAGSNGTISTGKGKANTGDREYILLAATNNQNNAGGALGIRLGYYDSQVNIDNNNVAKGTASFAFANSQWYNYETIIKDDFSFEVRVWLDGAARPSSPTLTAGAFTPVATGSNFRFSVNGGVSGVNYFDDIRVRKYSASEPVVSIGPETVKSAGNEASLPHWLESDSKAWVRVASLPSGNSLVYMYHGSPSAASASNGTAAFALFDDFNSGSAPDAGKWTLYSSGGYPSVSGGMLTVSAAGVSSGVESKISFDNTYAIRARAVSFGYTSTVTGLVAFGATGATFTYDYAGAYGNWPNGNLINAFMTAGGTGAFSLGHDGSSPHIYDLMRSGSQAVVHSDGIYKGTLSGGPAGALYAKFSGQNAPTATVFDWVLVRKYASAAPSLSFSGQEALDPVAPVVSISSPNASLDYSSLSVPLNFTASDASGVSACKYSLNGAANVSLAGCANATITAASGSNSLVLWASDGTNWGFASVSFAVDNTPPSVLLQSPVAQNYSSASVPVNFTVSDNVAVSSCSVSLNSTLSSSSCDNYTLTLGNGVYLLNLTANDSAGNVNSSSVAFNVSLPAGQPPAQSNSTQAATGSNGIAAANVSFSFTPASLRLTVGSQESNKQMRVSSGVNKVELRAMLTSKGSAVPNKPVTFTVSE